jgi:hypothetical protein
MEQDYTETFNFILEELAELSKIPGQQRLIDSREFSDTNTKEEITIKIRKKYGYDDGKIEVLFLQLKKEGYLLSINPLRMELKAYSGYPLSESIKKSTTSIKTTLAGEVKSATMLSWLKKNHVKTIWGIIIALVIFILNEIIKRKLDNYPKFPCWECLF